MQYNKTFLIMNGRCQVENQPAFEGLKVAIVDDSRTIRSTAEAILKKAGCEVRSSEDGFAALSDIVDFAPDVVFVDVLMPRLDGYQMCSVMKKNRLFKNTPVIMLSSKDGMFDRARGRLAGSDEYLTKPFTKEELLGAISNNVQTTQSV